MDSRSSIALVVLDTLRKDYFDTNFQWLDGRRYEWAWSPSHCTPPVHAGIFTGQYPREVGVHGELDTLEQSYTTLAERLPHAGYHTSAYSANPLISPRFGFDRGFADFDMAWPVRDAAENLFDWSSAVSGKNGVRKYLEAVATCIKSDQATIPSLRHGIELKLAGYGIAPYNDDGAKKCLKRVRESEYGSGPVFQFINLMEAHSPYTPPDEYSTVTDYFYPDAINVSFDSELRSEVDWETVKQSYENSVRYLSDIYRDVFDVLSQEFDLIITISDHGELFGEDVTDGLWGHFHGIYPELTHVPMVVSGAQIDDERIERPVSLVDVYSTVLDAAGIIEDGSNNRSYSLLSTSERPEFLTETHGISDMQIAKLDDGTESLKTAKSFDKGFSGIVGDEYYGYRSMDAFREVGNSPFDDPKSRLEALSSNIESTASTQESVGGRLENQLEDLGYL